MKFIDEYRDPVLARKIIDRIHETTMNNWVIMEVCGGQTHSIIKHGIDQLIPDNIELVHGPGCPVCVTPLETIDKAIRIASKPDVIFTSFGDMLRVPGSDQDLFTAKSAGADVRMVYSPLEAVQIARDNPDKEVVFFAVGFETTAPGNAMAILAAHREKLNNFSELVSHVLVPPAMEALLSSENNRVQGYLAAGHVCAVMGWNEYEPISKKYKVPIVPTGFEPIDILQGICKLVELLENGEHIVSNQYLRAVQKNGNSAAVKAVNEVYEVTDRKWRGIGSIPGSGLRIRKKFIKFDAEHKFNVTDISPLESDSCISGQVLLGQKKPLECPAFGTDCTPVSPLGATMVSSEGACAAYYKYQRFNRTGS